MKWIRSRAQRPIASITFDGFPRSAWSEGAPILARFGVAATYYAGGRLCGRSENGIDYFSEDDLLAARRAGHEIGALGPDHRRAAEILVDHDVCSFAYADGAARPRGEAAVASGFATARGRARGLNAGMIDLAALKVVPLERRRWNPGEIDAVIDRAKARNGWMVFVAHDVSDAPSPAGCTPAMLAHVLERLGDEGVSVLPVKHAMARAVFGS